MTPNAIRMRRLCPIGFRLAVTVRPDRYVDREGTGCFSNTAPSASRRRLDEVGRDLLQLVMQFRNTAAAALPGYALLGQVLQEQFDVTQEEQDDTSCAIATPRNPADMPCDGISNPADPDASYNAHRGLGYMAQIVETYAAARQSG